MLLFSEVAKTFDLLEQKSGRLEMTDILAELLKKVKTSEVDKLVYLIQGILAPPYEGTDLGIGERFAIEAIAISSGNTVNQVDRHYKKSGDLGITAEQLLSKKTQTSLGGQDLNLTYLFKSLLKIGKSSGPGSQELKIKLLAELLNNGSPLEARFIVRFALGRLRLGVGDPTILDSISVAHAGDKSLRESLERAYNVCADMGYVARLFYEDPKNIKKFKVQPFKPLMPALAERLSTPEQVIKKIGKCAIDSKYDGFRLQCHKKGDNVELYSRKLERMTHMFPDVVDAIKQLKAKEIIFEAEALAYNEKAGRYFSFQQTMHRRRKHGIDAASKELPLNLFCFDILYLNKKDLTTKPYQERRKTLQKVFRKKKTILKPSKVVITDDVDKVEELFSNSLNQGLEGIIAKDLSAQYTAGKRKFAWIKLKKSYGQSVDTIDGIIVGYFLGKGSRAEFKFGGLLVAVYNPEHGRLETVAKIGSGFTEDEMSTLREMLHKTRTKNPVKDLDYEIEPDFWVQPKYVVEVAFDDITKSPTHTCGKKDGKGYALRFPRMLSLRDDKTSKEATTTQEVIEMFELQHSRQ